MLYRVKFEIDIEAETPLEAANKTNDLLNEGDHKWQYDITDQNGKTESIDLEDQEPLDW